MTKFIGYARIIDMDRMIEIDKVDKYIDKKHNIDTVKAKIAELKKVYANVIIDIDGDIVCFHK